MRLYIAEKPSLGRAIVSALPKPHKRGEGFVEVGNGDIVSWCIGHLLEQAEPHKYDEAYKKWRVEDLPIIPTRWKLNAKSGTRKQLSVLRKLIKQADELVHAGDPDREGQLLVDEVIQFVGITDQKKASVKRLLVNDMNQAAVQRALNQMKSNREFIPLATSALARSRADWLYGINMTRAFTLAGQRVGFNGVLSVGRVQTPVLGLVVRRDFEIENFKPAPFYEVFAKVHNEKKEIFTVKWQPSEACEKYSDDEGRILDRRLAEQVASSVQGQDGAVEKYDKKPKKQQAPLPYSLSALQIDAAKRFAMSAQQVLSTCQELYEKHNLITYPRSDCRYLPKEQLGFAKEVIAAVQNNCGALSEAAINADLDIKSRAWNDKKVGAHHAIVPTGKKADLGRLGKAAAQVYELIARQYLVQFYSEHCYTEVKAAVRIQTGLFTASSRNTTDLGWKQLFPVKNKLLDKVSDKNESHQLETDYSNNHIPELAVGEPIHCDTANVIDKKTTPPQAFTDASLLAAMTGISRFVKDPDVRKILKDTDGLGTEATRASIIELLFKRDFLNREGKKIVSTQAGRALIACLPEAASLPDMTAQWESQLGAISQRESSYQAFIDPLLRSLNELVEFSATARPESLRGVKSKAKSYKKKRKKRTMKTRSSTT